MVTETNYKEDVAKYAKDVSDAAIETIKKFCGIALHNNDSRYVALSDEAEVKRVVEGFATKKLGLAEAAARAGLHKVHERMKADKTKNRVTVYYLLAEETGTLAKIS